MNKFVRENQFSLLTQRRFGPLWVVQFTSALLNQLMRGLLAGSILGLLFIPPYSLETQLFASAWFVVPGLLLAAYAGQLADFRDPRRIALVTVILGLGAAIAASISLAYGNRTALLVGAALAGCQAALFVPARGRLLRLELSDQQLPAGNGLVLAGWQFAALFAVWTGFVRDGEQTRWLIAAIMTLAGLSLLAGIAIPTTSAAVRKARSWAPKDVVGDTLKTVFKDRNVLLAVSGIGWFWLTSLTYLIYLPEQAATAFGVTQRDVVSLLAAPLIGTALGSLICAPASGRRVELGLVPLGSLLMTVAGLDFYLFAMPAGEMPSYLRLFVSLLLLGTGAGLFVVPLMAWLIQASPPSRVGRVQGGMYLCVVLFIGVGLAITRWCYLMGVSTSTILLGSTLLLAAVSIYIFKLLPEFLLRLVMWMLIHTIYRVREEGLDNVPLEGPAVIVCNHVSYLDALVIGAKLRRPSRFVMHKHIFTVPGFGLLFRLYKAIPIASGRTDPETLAAAMDQVAKELEAGQLVAIFPEGHLTHDGEIDVFRSGIEKIIARTPVPVVPVALQGLWGSFFSNKGGPALTHAPRWRWSRLGLVVGEPVPPEEVSATDLQARVQALRGDLR